MLIGVLPVVTMCRILCYLFFGFSSFTDDWSPFTGDCGTNDPTGKPHHCCGTGTAAQYCPTSTFLSALTDLAIWAEGVAGDFQIEAKWIGVSK